MSSAGETFGSNCKKQVILLKYVEPKSKCTKRQIKQKSTEDKKNNIDMVYLRRLDDGCQDQEQRYGHGSKYKWQTYLRTNINLY